MDGSSLADFVKILILLLFASTLSLHSDSEPIDEDDDPELESPLEPASVCFAAVFRKALLLSGVVERGVLPPSDPDSDPLELEPELDPEGEPTLSDEELDEFDFVPRDALLAMESRPDSESDVAENESGRGFEEWAGVFVGILASEDEARSLSEDTSSGESPC